MGRKALYAEATGTAGMGTSAIAMAISKEECINKN